MRPAIHHAVVSLIAAGCFASVLGLVLACDVALSIVTFSVERFGSNPRLGALVALDLGCSALIGLIVLKVAARAFPRRASGRVSSTTVVVIIGMLLALTAGSIAAVIMSRELYVLASAVQDAGRKGEMLNAAGLLAAVALAILPTVLLSAGNVICSLTVPLLIILGWHLMPQRWRTSQYVLFLRSFGGTSNMAALAPLTRGAAANARLVFIAAPYAQATSWNPMALAHSGLSTRHPLWSTPVYLYCDDSNWEAVVRRLAQDAKAIVIDVTGQRPAVMQEAALIRMLSTPRVLWLCEEATASSFPREMDLATNLERVIAYSESRWKQRIVRALTFVTTSVASFVVLLILIVVSGVGGSDDLPTVVIVALLLVSAILAGLVAITLCPAAGYTRRSAHDICSALRVLLIATSKTPLDAGPVSIQAEEI